MNIARTTAAASAVAIVVAASACGRSTPAGEADATPTTSAATLDGAPSAMANGPDAGGPKLAAPVATTTAPDPFGLLREVPKVLCTGVAGKHVADKDLRTSFVDGNDLLAIVNRSPTGVLSADYAPTDLVEFHSGRSINASECNDLHCLRKETHDALQSMLGEMKKLGFPGRLESAFRSYGVQCGTFLMWSRKGTFCDAAEQSALPGHSQHQLGTTVDLFTAEWGASARSVFREGFGCTPGGKFLQERGWEFGFVLSYPIHPYDRHPKQKCVVRWDIPINIDPRTGYRFEHWHVRYIGKEAASRFRKAYEASGPDAPNEITLEQFLRTEKGISGPEAELPVCDGCNCGACATLAPPGEGTCDKKSGGAIHLDAHGKIIPPAEPPMIESVRRGASKRWHGRVVDVKVGIQKSTPTQPPVVGLDGLGYEKASSFERLVPYPDVEARGYVPLPGAWVIAVEPIPNDTGVAWPYRAALTIPLHGQIYNRANVILPARAGDTTIRVPIPSGITKVKVTLMESGVPRGEMLHLDFRSGKKTEDE